MSHRVTYSSLTHDAAQVPYRLRRANRRITVVHGKNNDKGSNQQTKSEAEQMCFNEQVKEVIVIYIGAKKNVHHE